MARNSLPPDSLCCLLEIQRSIKIMEKFKNTKEVKAKKREKETKQNKIYFLMEKNVIPFVTDFIHRSDSDVTVLFTYLPLTALCKL